MEMIDGTNLKILTRCLILGVLPLEVFAATPPKEISLHEMLRKAAEVSPQVAGARLREVASQHKMEIEKAAYYPQVNLEAVDSTGFPGSVAHLGISGLLASPFRSGAAAGVSGNIPIWDFGRTMNAVTAAEHDSRAQQEDVKYRRYQVYQTALELYYQCALYRNLKEAWTDLAEGAQILRNAVNGFVITGQRSIVERYLVDSQLENARTQVSVFGEKEKGEVREIGILIDTDPNSIACPLLPSEEQAMTFFKGTPEGNPIVAYAIEATEAARARVKQAKADFMPKLVGVADAAVMQNYRLVDQDYYAVGAALILPLFEGFATVNKVQEATALAAGAEKDLEARKLEISELNAKYDKMIESSRTALVHLRDELALANEGFTTAKKRFVQLQGTVVDVREAFNNLTRTQTESIQTQAAFLQAIGAKAVLNGTPF
jgi:outer membrane protein